MLSRQKLSCYSKGTARIDVNVLTAVACTIVMPD